MLFRPAPTLTPPDIAEWRWTGARERDLRGEAVIARRSRIGGAVHAGHAVRVAFELRVVSGPAPRLSIACSSADAARWVAQVLVPAYGRSSWTRETPSDPAVTGEVEWGRRVRSWPDRLREAGDGLAATSQLLLALTGVPLGNRLRWRFAAAPASWKGPPADGDGRLDGRPRALGPPRNESPVARTWHDPRRTDSVAPLFWTSSLGLEFSSAAAGQADVRARVRAAVEAALRSGRANGVRFSRRPRLRFWPRPWFEISEEELSWILPDGEVPGVASRPTVVAPLPTLPLGRSDAGVVVGPSIEPEQGRHLAILGETGMGKSATLVALALAAKEFGGVILFDPLGETAEGLVRGLTPAERTERLTRVAPTQGSAGINALEGVARPDADAVGADRRLDDLVHALRRVRFGRYDARYWGPRLEEMLTRALDAAAALPGGTLADAHTLLATGGRIRPEVRPEARETVRSLADRIRDRPEDAEGARRLLYEVVRSPVLREMLSNSHPDVHTAELVAPGKIALISGDAARVGESVARYLLAIYLALVWSELLARPTASKTFVLLDEAQWYAHESLAEMLRLARRRNVHVVVATQTVSSLPEEVGEAIWTNVSDFVAFRGSPDEARELSRASSHISVEELLSLPRGHAVVLLGKGNSVAWVRTVGRPSGPDPLPSGHDSVLGTTKHSGRVPDESPGHPEVDTEAVLEWLRGRAREAPEGHPIRVVVSELRRSVDPDGRAVRAAGALLGRRGALLKSVREDSGSVWTVDPRRLPSGPSGTVDTTPNGDAHGTQPS